MAKCGCRIDSKLVQTEEEELLIIYCPLHASAERMKEALKAIRDSKESDLGVYAKFCLDTSRAALAGEEKG